jgi:hypothetical protein
MIRLSVTTACLLAVAGLAHAEDFQVLDNVDGAAPQKMMERYLLTEAQAALDRREEPWRQVSIATPQARAQDFAGCSVTETFSWAVVQELLDFDKLLFRNSGQVGPFREEPSD